MKTIKVKEFSLIYEFYILHQKIRTMRKKCHTNQLLVSTIVWISDNNNYKHSLTSCQSVMLIRYGLDVSNRRESISGYCEVGGGAEAGVTTGWSTPACVIRSFIFVSKSSIRLVISSIRLMIWSDIVWKRSWVCCNTVWI